MDTTDTISTKMWRSRQALEGEMLATTASGTRLRAQVCRDSYDFQSYASVSAWTPEKGWVTVTTMPLGDTRIRNFSYVTRDEQGWREAIGLDLLALIHEAERFLG